MVRESIALLCQKGREALAQHDQQLARRFFQAALTLKPDDPEVHHGLATVQFLLNDLDGAAHHFTQVTKLDPGRAGAFINLGAIYNQLDRLDEAIGVLRRGIQLDPHRAEGYYNLALAYRRKGQTDMAVQAYLETVRVNPKMADAYFNLGNLYLETDRFGLAIANYKRALEVRPHWDKAEDGLARAEAAQAGIALPDRTIEEPTPPEPEPKGEESPHRALRKQLDPTRLVDPDRQGVPLKTMHQTAIECDADSRELAEVLSHQLEPAIKDLSATLLMSDSPISELEERLHKFEKAVRDMRKIEQTIGERMKKVQNAGEQIVEG